MTFPQKSLPWIVGLFFGLTLLRPAFAMPIRSDVGPFCVTQDTWIVGNEETSTGDLYLLAPAGASMNGTHEGDLFLWAPSATVRGTIDGDFFAFGNTVDISGTIRDSTRLAAMNMEISGRVEGDLVVFLGTVTILETGVVTGKVTGAVQHLNLLGTVGGDLEVTAGGVRLLGSVGGNAQVKADRVELGPDARIEGDLQYRTRTALPEDVADRVGGEVIEMEEDEEPGAKVEPLGGIPWWYWPVAAYLLGCVVLGLTGRRAAAPVQRIREEGWLGLAIGAFALPVLVVVSVLAIVLVLTIPIGAVGLLLAVTLAYLGKIPFALWLGSSLLRRVGFSNPSRYLALALGLALCYGAFRIPFYVGALAWYLATSVGIGSLVLALRATSPDSEPQT